MRIHVALVSLLLFLLPDFLMGQVSLSVSPADAANLTGMTTPIEVHFSDDDRPVDGSGFFYIEFSPDEAKATGPRWRTITHVYVVTAKHVIQPGRIKQLVSLTYAVRVESGDHVDWHRFSLDGKEVGKRLHLCKKDEIDVAVVDVTDALTGAGMKELLAERAHVLSPNGANSDEFPGKSPIEVQPGDDVIVIGYPLGFYDQFNKLPVLKTGLLNTPVGLRYNGLDAFLLDFKYYEGSSGSLIISKPTHFSFTKEGAFQTSTSRLYVFLGVYQGEEYWNEDKTYRPDLGIGWYYYNVDEAIKNPPLVH